MQRKKCRGNYYPSKISHLKNSKPKNWGREVKQICGHSPLNNHKDLPSLLAVDDIDRMFPDDQADLISNTFLQPQQVYQPLDEWVKIYRHLDQAYTTFMKLKALNPNKSPGPDGIPSWVYKEFAEILAYPISLKLLL